MNLEGISKYIKIVDKWHNLYEECEWIDADYTLNISFEYSCVTNSDEFVFTYKTAHAARDTDGVSYNLVKWNVVTIDEGLTLVRNWCEQHKMNNL